MRCNPCKQILNKLSDLELLFINTTISETNLYRCSRCHFANFLVSGISEEKFERWNNETKKKKVSWNSVIVASDMPSFLLCFPAFNFHFCTSDVLFLFSFLMRILDFFFFGASIEFQDIAI